MTETPHRALIERARIYRPQATGGQLVRDLADALEDLVAAGDNYLDELLDLEGHFREETAALRDQRDTLLKLLTQEVRGRVTPGTDGPSPTPR